MRFRALAVGEVGLQQRLLERQLLAGLALDLGPVQQAVGVEDVVDAVAPLHAEGEAQLGAALADGVADGLLLLRGGAIFLRQVLGDVLAAGRHTGVELEGLKVQVGVKFGCQPGQRLFQRAQTNGAPGAGHIRHEINGEGGGHGQGLTMDKTAR